MVKPMTAASLFADLLMSTQERLSCILQHLVPILLFTAHDNTCVCMNMTCLSFARIDYRKVPTLLNTCERPNPINQMPLCRPYLLCSDIHIAEINTTSTLIDINLPHAPRSRKT
jgi:hypothetical protein